MRSVAGKYFLTRTAAWHNPNAHPGSRKVDPPGAFTQFPYIFSMFHGNRRYVPSKDENASKEAERALARQLYKQKKQGTIFDPNQHAEVGASAKSRIKTISIFIAMLLNMIAVTVGGIADVDQPQRVGQHSSSLQR